MQERNSESRRLIAFFRHTSVKKNCQTPRSGKNISLTFDIIPQLEVNYYSTVLHKGDNREILTSKGT